MSGVRISSYFVLHYQVFRLFHEEGFFCGSSSGVNVAAAIEVAKLIGPGKTIVTTLNDTGHKYTAKLYTRSVLDSYGLLDYVPEAYRKSLR